MNPDTPTTKLQKCKECDFQCNNYAYMAQHIKERHAKPYLPYDTYPGFKYLSKEIRHEKEDLNERLQKGTINPLAHAIWNDALRFVEARIAVAKLMDREKRDESLLSPTLEEKS